MKKNFFFSPDSSMGRVAKVEREYMGHDYRGTPEKKLFLSHTLPTTKEYLFWKNLKWFPRLYFYVHVLGTGMYKSNVSDY